MPGRLSLGVAVALAFACGCGPIEYVSQVTRRASADLASAKAVKADKYAPYHYTLAVEYLHKAREEAAHADYQSANEFGRRASSAAKQARVLAIERAGDPDFENLTPEKIRGEGDGDGEGDTAPLGDGGDE